MRTLCLVLLLIAAASPALLSPPSAAPVLDEEARRRPFALELPDLGGARITAPEARIPTHGLHTIKMRVFKPLADEVRYGAVHTKINGESSGTIQDVRGASDGYVVLLDLDKWPRFRLQPGRNVVEISANDRQGRAYYASYVLLAGGQGGGGAAAAGDASADGATVESVPVASGPDTQPPTVCLTQPGGAPRAAGAAGTFKIAGLAADESGQIASVKINGAEARLAPAAATRGLTQVETPGEQAGPPCASQSAVAFEQQVAAGAPLVVEARDRAGNLTRLTVPVRRREPPASAAFKGRKFALIVGVSRYKYQENGLKNLSYPDADARAVRDFLQSSAGGGFQPANVAYLENEAATLDGVRGALAQLLPKAAPSDLLFVFIAAHGSPDPYAPQNLYFILHDTKVADMPRTALPMTELQQALDGARAERVVVFVDTCHSAGLSGEQLVSTRSLTHENNLINLYAARLYRETGRAVLTSSDVNELSQESRRWGGGHGIFTWALLEGLRGAADHNADRYVTAGELFSFVRDRVVVETAGRQNPRALAGLNADLTLSVAE